MIEGVREWILGVTAAAVLAALAQTLMPDGPVKTVGRLTCSLVVLAAMLRPLAALDPAQGSDWLRQYSRLVEENRLELEQEKNSWLKAVIEEKTAAYILDKAAQMGLECTVRVGCRQDGEGNFLPFEAYISDLEEGNGQEELSRMLTQELGIAPQQQFFLQEGGK